MNDHANLWQKVCEVGEIENPGSYAFELSGGNFPIPGFLVRNGETIFAYVNVCPHLGRHMQWAPHRFLTKDLQNIICAAHGAVFEIDTGLCVGGPCLGDSLRSLSVRVRDSVIEVQRPDTKN